MAKSAYTLAPPEQDSPKLVVVGNGMVGASFCEKLVALGLDEQFEIHVFGEEPRPAYDRVRLSNYVLNHDPARLELLSKEWYESHGIHLHLEERVVSLVPEEKRLTTDQGESHRFDHVVLATGSRPFEPPIPGIDLSNIFVYRTIEDLEQICEAAKGAKSAAILGGGLLGLEAAQALQHLEVESIHVVELANFLMPQQLNPEASDALLQSVEQQGLTLHLGERASGFEKSKDSLTVKLEKASIDVDLVVVAAGIRPRSELAESSGIELGGRGGIRVDDSLMTSADSVYAIGECAEHRNRIYGLAAPGFRMAEVLAKHLAGKSKVKFEGADTSTRLKMLGVDVITVGNPLQPGKTSEYKNEANYRLLSFDPKGRLSGALIVGSWSEAGQVQAAIQQGRKLRPRHIKEFEETGIIWSESENVSATSWPSEAIVCNCMQVSKATICDQIDSGTRDVEQIKNCTGAGTVCGSCCPLIAELAGEVITEKRGFLSSRFLLAISSSALLLALIIFLFPPLPIAQSVTEGWYQVESIWRDFVAKQITGYTLMGMSALGLVLSLRKRIRWFRFGDFLNWRAIHAGFGLASLFALFAHTGFQFGDNLNFWLMFVFVLLNLLGAFAGIIASLEVRGTGRIAIYARRLRPSLTWAHIVLFWPFPILLGFHILSVYLY
ncbi:MAG: FAD-dependent oxidoreductase [Verrucomicrobiota bacterium]